MAGQGESRDIVGLQADVLDHAREFVELVYLRAPLEYQRLLSSERFRPLSEGGLGQDGNFNHGKLYVYAEFSAFRREFADRFPGASPAACINAFSSLFLKNDISIHNLLEFVEGADERGPGYSLTRIPG